MKKMKTLALLLLCSLFCYSASAKDFVLKNDKVELAINKRGELVTLKNITTGHNYASGGYMWRMYYDTRAEQEIEVVGGDSKPQVVCSLIALCAIHGLRQRNAALAP